MALRRHKVRTRPGRAEMATIALVLAAVTIMFVGPVALPGREWARTSGQVLEFYTYRNATTADGQPLRVQLSYRYHVDGTAYEDDWDGEWPETHSPNALPADSLDRLRDESYFLIVHYDPENPGRSNLHLDSDRASVWWLRLSVALAALVLWYVFVVYPRMKRAGRA